MTVIKIFFTFQGSKFWEFDDARKQVVTSTGQSIAEYWFLCPPSHLEVSTNYGNYAQSDFLVFSVATLFLIILI